MLKQVFNKEQLSKALTPSDVWRWDLLASFEDVEAAIDHTIEHWKSHSLTLSPVEKRISKQKPVFTPSTMEDAFAIKLLDRFIRRTYKVRQSDRNRIIRQLKTLLKDSGKHHILRFDIKDCYESIPLQNLIRKLEDDLIIAPACIKLLANIHADLANNHNMHGLPRGLPISPTLAELYLESLDKKIVSHPDVIYSSRYVDDILVLTATGKEKGVEAEIERFMNEIGLQRNSKTSKYHNGPSDSAKLEHLGYSIEVEPRKEKPNKVTLKIAKSKLKKLKSRIAISFCDYKRQNNIHLLKRRLEYLCMLKVVRKGKNGNLLAGIANNYQYVTDNFECLKCLDGFLCNQLTSPRFGLTPAEQLKIKKISIYGNAKKRNIGKFSNKQTVQIMRAWKNA